MGWEELDWEEGLECVPTSPGRRLGRTCCAHSFPSSSSKTHPAAPPGKPTLFCPLLGWTLASPGHLLFGGEPCHPQPSCRGGRGRFSWLYQQGVLIGNPSPLSCLISHSRPLLVPLHAPLAHLLSVDLTSAQAPVDRVF